MRRDMLSHVATMAKSSLNKHEAKLLWDYPGPANDDGTPGEDHVVRAWRVGRPDSGTYAMTVYVVPGRLIMVGDCGPLVFERVYDMVAWARRCISDPHYMFGKIPHEFKTREFSEEKAAAWLAEIRKYHRKTIGDQYDELKAMTGDLESFRYVYEEMVRKELADDFPDVEDWSSHVCWCYEVLKVWLKKADPQPLASTPKRD